MKLLTVSFLLPVWAVGQSQTSAGSCSPNIVSSGSGAVTVQLNGSCNGVDPRVVRELTQGVQKFLIQFPKTIGHLNELLDKKDVELTTKAREIDNWIKKYNELSKELQEVSGKQLQPQPAADDVSRKAAEALDRGDLGIAETLLNDLHAEVESGELAARAEVLLAQDPSAARDMAIAAWAKKHTGAARNALVDTHSAPVLTIDPGRFSVGSFSPDGQRAVTGGTYSTMLVIWDAATGKALTRTEGKQGALNGYSIGTRGVEFSSDSRRVLGTFNGEPPTVFDMATGTPLAKLGAPAKFAAFVSLDGERVATTNDGPLSVLDVTTGIPVTRLDWLKGSELTLSPNGQSVVTFGLTRGSQSQVFNMAAGKSLAPLGGEAYSAKFSHDSLRVVTAEFAGVRVCDAISGRQLAIMAGSAGSATSAHAEYAEFSGDGTRVVAAMSDSTARIWEAATGDQLAVLTGHSERVGMAVFSPDGQRVLTSSQDGTVRLWDAATGAPLARLNLPPLPQIFNNQRHEIVRSALFSSDGQEALVVGDLRLYIFKIVSSGDAERLFPNGSR